MKGLASRIDAFREAGATLVAVGPQTPADAKSMELPFPVLSDPDLHVTGMFGLVHPKGSPFGDVPRPTTLILDAKGRILWLRATDNVRVRPEPGEVLEALRRS